MIMIMAMMTPSQPHPPPSPPTHPPPPKRGLLWTAVFMCSQSFDFFVLS